jgi:hypothetical protein
MRVTTDKVKAETEGSRKVEIGVRAALPQRKERLNTIIIDSLSIILRYRRINVH